MNWSMKCGECKGSGCIKKPDSLKPYKELPDNVTCPTCKGSGDLELVVEIVCPNYSKPSANCIHCPSPQATQVRIKKLCTTHRPLTVDEVEEAGLDWLMEMETYKGSQVTLRGRVG